MAVTVRSARAPKRFIGGTHRTVAPAETVAWAMERADRVGITRVADVTGLDHLGIPVVMVVRPNARCISVAQGKGVDLDAARASGLMESIEAFHAEHVDLPVRLVCHRELASSERVVDPTLIARPATSLFTPLQRIPWVSGRSLDTGEAVWVPLEAVEIDASIPAGYLKGCFHLTTNGLASGNHVLEAISHGLLEVIERDAMYRWALRPDRDATRLSLDSIDDPLVRPLLDRLDAAGVAVATWNATSDIAVPCVSVTLVDREAQPFRRMYASEGQGCHLDARVALMRAITEAAQARLTWIAGSRDDLPRALYQQGRSTAHLEAVRAEVLACPAEAVDASTLPMAVNDTVDDDVADVVAAIDAAGAAAPVVVDLTRPELGIPVVKVVAPGLAPDRDLGPAMPMPRTGEPR